MKQKTIENSIIAGAVIGAAGLAIGYATKKLKKRVYDENIAADPDDFEEENEEDLELDTDEESEEPAESEEKEEPEETNQDNEELDPSDQ